MAGFGSVLAGVGRFWAGFDRFVPGDGQLQPHPPAPETPKDGAGIWAAAAHELYVDRHTATRTQTLNLVAVMIGN